MTVRDRVVEVRTMLAGELLKNPANWRNHPPSQRATLRAVFEEVGFAGTLLAYEDDDGQLVLIDGYLRAELEPDAVVHVAVTDLTKAEADEVLATFDPISAMAQPDQDKLVSLYSTIESRSQDVRKLLEAVANGERFPMPPLGQPAPASPFLDPMYVRSVQTPIYEVKGERPAPAELYSDEKARALIADIEAAEVPEEVEQFLRLAALRHVRFNFAKIAEFYAHADAGVQRLMESSALVIIDFGKAIEEGFVAAVQRMGEFANADADIEDDDEE